MGSQERSSKRTGQEEQHQQPASPLLLGTGPGPPPHPTSQAALKSCRKQPASARLLSRISSSLATQGHLYPLPEGDFAPPNKGTCSPLRGKKEAKQPQEKGLRRVFPLSPTTICISLSVPSLEVSEAPPSRPAQAPAPSCILPTKPH